MLCRLTVWLGFWLSLYQRFVENRGAGNAAALTYTTLFAVVPMMTVTFAMLSAIPAFQGVGEEIQGFNHYDKAGSYKVDKSVEEASANDYDALVLPGGVGNPDNLRQDENAVRFVRDFFEQGKPVGAICHAPWTLIEAGVVRDRTVTSFPSLQTDLRNAGANWVDEQVHVDNGLVTSRKPDDIQAFNAKLIEEFAEGRHEQQAAKTPGATS